MTTENETKASDGSRSIDGLVSGTIPSWLRCKNCKWRNKLGRCTNEDKIHEDWVPTEEDDHLIYSYPESGGFDVGPNFGCVHFSR